MQTPRSSEGPLPLVKEFGVESVTFNLGIKHFLDNAQLMTTELIRLSSAMSVDTYMRDVGII